MSPHMQFLIVDIIAMLVTSPLVVLAWRRMLARRGLIAALYVAGYAVIAAAFIIDSLYNPPLFAHGFTPGIGIGLLLGCIGLYVEESQAARLNPQLAAKERDETGGS